MKTVRRLIYGDVIQTVSFVTLAFMSLFFFFDLVDELRWVNQGKSGYTLSHAFAFVSLLAPGRVYELLPITVLIGTIVVMARLAQNSEFTILRTSGLGPSRALRALLVLGLMFTLLTFAIGDYIAPAADHYGRLLRSRYTGELTIGQTGAWLKEKQAYSAYAVNVGTMQSDGGMRQVRIIEFDNQGRLVSNTKAQTGRFGADDAWHLEGVDRTEFRGTAGNEAVSTRINLPTYRWPTSLSAEMVAVALLNPDRMPIVDLFQYMRHLDANGQSSQRYEIGFWRKLFYPMSCLVMVVLALPFAYLHFRAGGISTYVFIGVMIGISFFLLNSLFGHFGNLRNWEPWLTSAAPGLIYSLLSLSAFGWLVLRR